MRVQMGAGGCLVRVQRRVSKCLAHVQSGFTKFSHTMCQVCPVVVSQESTSEIMWGSMVGMSLCTSPSCGHYQSASS